MISNNSTLFICAQCGKPATCYGQYDENPEGYACDDCCAHDEKNGNCQEIRIFSAPFTAAQWYDISLCIGLTLTMADDSPEGQARRETAQQAMDSMHRVFGDGFHTKISKAAVGLERQ